VPDYWESSKRLLSDATKFLDSLLNFSKDNIPEPIIKRIEPYIAMEEFTPEAVSKVSKACTSICMWVRAMPAHHMVSLGVSGLMRGRRACQVQAASGVTLPRHCHHERHPRMLMSRARRSPRSVQPWRPHRSPWTRRWLSLRARRHAWQLCRRKLPRLRLSMRLPRPRRPRWQHRCVCSLVLCCEAFSRGGCAAFGQCAQHWLLSSLLPLLQVADCQVKLQRADKLIGGLGGERCRWTATVHQLQRDLDNLVGDVILAAGVR
jgi:hypothetical protein